MRLLAVLILSLIPLLSFSGECPSGTYQQETNLDEGAMQSKINTYSSNSSFIPAQYSTVNGITTNRVNTTTWQTEQVQLYNLCRLPAPVVCDPENSVTGTGKFGVNYYCIEKCPDGYEKNQAGHCVDSNGCTQDKFLKEGQCSDRCSEYGSNSTGYNHQTRDCNFTDQCGAMQKRQRFDLSTSTGLGSGACVDDPNGCPTGYSWLPSTNGGGNACRSTSSEDVNTTCPAGTSIVGDGSTGQCQASGDENSASSSTSSSGAPSSSSGTASSTSSGAASSSGASTSSGGGGNDGGGSGSGPNSSSASSTSSGGSNGGGTGGTSSGAASSGSSSGGQTGGYSGRCDIPPQCQNSASIECAQLYQTWFAGCPLKGYTHQTYVEGVEDGKASVRELFDGFKTRVTAAPVIDGFSDFLSFNKTGSCPTWEINLPWFTASFDYLCSPMIPWGVISSVLTACSLLVAFRLAAK